MTHLTHYVEAQMNQNLRLKEYKLAIQALVEDRAKMEHEFARRLKKIQRKFEMEE